MRTTGLIILVLALVFGATACASDGTSTDTTATSATDTCICGTREADLDGCPCKACVEGGGNPDNPHCICGGLHADPSGGK